MEDMIASVRLLLKLTLANKWIYLKLFPDYEIYMVLNIYDIMVLKLVIVKIVIIIIIL